MDKFVDMVEVGAYDARHWGRRTGAFLLLTLVSTYGIASWTDLLSPTEFAQIPGFAEDSYLPNDATLKLLGYGMGSALALSLVGFLAGALLRGGFRR